MNIIKKDGYSIIFKGEGFPIDRCILALGNFDGVHVAHRQLLSNALKLKHDSGARYVGAWSFYENPLAVLTDSPPPFIYTPMMKAEIMLSLGVDFVILCDFSHFKDIDHTDFINDHLIGELGCMGAVCGFNFSFGRFGKGKPEHLMDAFGQDMFCEIPEYQIDGTTVSSTLIRKMLRDGDVSGASAFLGSPFYIDTPVVRGKQLGRKLNLPTANQYFEDGRVTLPRGVYAVRCTLGKKKYIGVTNVGIRPTVDDRIDDHMIINAETYILDFSGDIYGESLKVEFLYRLRDEKKYTSLDELKNAIRLDAEHASNIVKIDV